MKTFHLRTKEGCGRSSVDGTVDNDKIKLKKSSSFERLKESDKAVICERERERGFVFSMRTSE